MPVHIRMEQNLHSIPFMIKLRNLLCMASLAGAMATQAQTTTATNSVQDNAAQAAARSALLQGENAQSTPAAAVTNAPAAVQTASASAMAEPAPATNAVAEASPATNASPAPVEAQTVQVASPPAAEPSPAKAASIPLIQFSDVSLTTAIENLARQANINYMLDPKIAYGQPDASGQVKAEPTLSIRWENITAEKALLALLDNYGLQMVNDQQTGIARITIKDPSAPPPLETRVVQLKYASVSNMVTAVVSTLTDKRSKVIPDIRTSQLVIVATEPEQDAAEILVNRLDTVTKQVLIETKLVEISSNPTSQKGIDWTGTLQAQHVSFGNNSTYIVQPTAPTPGTATTVNGVTTISGAQPAQPGIVSGVLANPGVIGATTGGFGPEGFLNADGLNVVLSFLNSSEDAQIMSTPRVVTLDNQSAQISVIRTYPVFQVTAGTANTTGGSTVTYTNVGTVLNVTPRISANDRIWLRVQPQVSSFAGIQSQTVAGQTYQADLFDFRTFDTQVLIPNAHTLVMGGLVQDNPISTSTKVPMLGDLPGLGYLFRSETKTTTKDNLLIFITPTIVKDDNFQSSETQFLDTPATKRPTMVDPNNLWDGSHPYNWSNPTNTDPAQAIIDEKSVQ